MVEIESLMGEKYFLLKHIYSRCIWFDGEYFLEDSIDQLAEDANISKRTLCRLLKMLENDGFIKKSKINGKKYQLPIDVQNKCNQLFLFLDNLK